MKFSKFPFGLVLTIIRPLQGSTNPVRLTLDQLLFVGTIGNTPFNDHIATS